MLWNAVECYHPPNCHVVNRRKTRDSAELLALFGPWRGRVRDGSWSPPHWSSDGHQDLVCKPFELVGTTCILVTKSVNQNGLENLEGFSYKLLPLLLSLCQTARPKETRWPQRPPGKIRSISEPFWERQKPCVFRKEKP